MSVVQDPPLSPDKAPDPLRDVPGAVGRPLPRVDGESKVAGAARFAAEVALPDLTFAAVVYSRIARGSIASLETADAEAAPGVAFVMTYRNAPRMLAPLLLMVDPRGAAGSDLPVMQDASIHWNGEPVAVVIGETQEQADFAAGLIRVTYRRDDVEDVSFERNRAKAKVPDSVLGEPSRVEIGDAETALGAAPFKVDATYRTPRYNHNSIELHAATVSWEDETLTVHDTTQMLNPTRSCLAYVFGIPEENVRVFSPFVGGGFGGKGLWSHQILAAAASRVIRRPVRIVVSREGVFRAIGGRTLTEQRVALGAKNDGTLSALIHTGMAGMTSHNNCPEQFTFPARHLYASETLLIEQKIVELDMVANTFMRAPGESIGTFALESAIDELAEVLELDPIVLRQRLEPAKDPSSGSAFSSRHLVEAYARGAKRFGWEKRRAKPGSLREGDWSIGHGVATATYPYFRMDGGKASIRLFADGRATVRMASHEMGMGTATVQAQHAADRLGLPVERVTFEYGDTDMPAGTIAGGSSQSATIVAAVTAASEALVETLLGVAGNGSPLAGLQPNEIELRDGGMWSRHAPQRGERYASILARAGRDDVVCEAAAPPPDEMKAYSMHSYGAQFCEIRVHALTGETRVARWVGSFDTGRILNPRTAASQFRGGIVMGIGLALTEETLFDERTGRIMNPSLAEYHVPVHADVPDIDVIWNDIPDPYSPLGLHGIGEIGITGVAGAIANAIYNATGKRIREVPITLDKLLGADSGT